MQIKKISSLFVLIILFGTLSGCEKENEPKICLEGPCGSIVTDSMNVTIFVEDNVEITSIGLVIDDQEVPLSLEGLNYAESKFYTCWQTIPTISPTSSVILGYEINGEVVIGAFNVTRVSSNQIVIEIEGEDAEIRNFEECDDTLNG